MSARVYLGHVETHDGLLCLKSPHAPAWYPLGGNSKLAADFVETFGEAQAGDEQKRVYRISGQLCMENNEQRDTRLAREQAA